MGNEKFDTNILFFYSLYKQQIKKINWLKNQKRINQCHFKENIDFFLKINNYYFYNSFLNLI